MKYRISFKLTSPSKEESIMVKGVAEFYKCGFEYGNGKGMTLSFPECREAFPRDLHYDIRYDNRYNSDDERGYIKRFIREEYDGENESWRATYVTVKPIFELQEG